LYTNAQSLFGKIDELTATTSVLNPDIILITETWTNCRISDAMLQIPGKKLEGRTNRQDTHNGIGGGLIFYIKDCYDTEPVLDSMSTFNQYSTGWAESPCTRIKIITSGKTAPVIMHL
jgi:hypothetical protein